MRRKILFLTGIRSDFYIQRRLIKAVDKHPKLRMFLVVSGAHLKKEFGSTIKEIKKEKIKIFKTIDNLKLLKGKDARLKALSIQLSELIKIVLKIKPHIIVSPFDREESLTTAIIGQYLNIPVAHLGAGDYTKYNTDGIVRHAVTKLSHLIFCSTKKSFKNVIKLREQKFRIYNVGSLSVDRFKDIKKIRLKVLKRKLGIKFDLQKLILLIQHPVSNMLELTKKHYRITLDAIDDLNYPTIIIRPNSDPGSEYINNVLNKYKFKKNQNIKIYENIDEKLFVNILKYTKVLIGNSSMGIVEAPKLKIPVVNIGDRQKGRQKGNNVLYVKNNKKLIMQAIQKQLARKKKFLNPYKSHNTISKILNVFLKIKINSKLLNKQSLF